MSQSEFGRMYRGPKVAVIGAVLLGLIAAGGIVFFSHSLSSQAVQAPKMSLDMVTTGNTYDPSPPDGTNSMTVGTINRCLTTAPPGNNLTHQHSVHLVIQDVEDLIGWQAQLAYDGGKMRPNSVNFAPFSDTGTGQNISFQNLPIDGSGLHRDVSAPTNIPPAAPGPQKARIGATHLAARTLPVAPDSPAKAVPDDASYSAPTGGVLATISLQVPAGNAGQVLRMGLEDKASTPPGSKALIFTGTGQQKIELDDSALFDGYHLEGVALTSDTDVDTFSNQIECSAGTDPGAPCPTAPNHDAWPPDINNDTFVDVIGDISAVGNHAFEAVPPAPARYDIAPDPPDGLVDVIGDITRMATLFDTSCAP
jgi:hypothetical protein